MPDEIHGQILCATFRYIRTVSEAGHQGEKSAHAIEAVLSAPRIRQLTCSETQEENDATSSDGIPLQQLNLPSLIRNVLPPDSTDDSQTSIWFSQMIQRLRTIGVCCEIENRSKKACPDFRTAEDVESDEVIGGHFTVGGEDGGHVALTTVDVEECPD